MKDAITRAATALYGFALGVALAPSLGRAASPQDLPSGLKAAGQSASSLLAQFAVPLILTALFALIGARIARFVTEKPWVMTSYCVALALAPVTLMHFGNVRHVVLHGVVAAAIVFLRRLEPRFTREDVVLLPVLLSCFMAFLDIGFGKTPAATFLRAAVVVFAMRLIIGAIAKAPKPALAFAASPLALVAQMLWMPGLVALLILFFPPFFFAFLGGDEGVAAPLRTVVYPIAAYAYPLALLGIFATPHVDFYEDGHDIPVAREMMRGERPYRDVIPLHGLVTDGALSWTAMHLGAASIGSLLRVRLLVSAILMPAVYFVALAACGSAELAILAVFLALAMFPAEAVWLRPAIALLALACVIAGTRARSRRWFIAAGALIVIAALVSLDFALYTLIIALIASIRSRAIVPLVIGIVVTFVPVLIIFAACRFAPDFFHVTFFDILGNRGAYFIGPIEFPPCLRSLSGIVTSLGDTRCLAFLVWIVALIASFTVLDESVWIVGGWIVLAGASYIDRRNVFFAVAAAPFIVAALAALHRRARHAAIALAIVVIFIARPFDHVMSVLPSLRKSHGIPAGDAVTIDGALFSPQAAQAINTARRFTATMPPNETFVDFAGATMLYPLLNRDCPLRQMQIGLYESERAQREVIDRLERNRNITAALIAFPPALSNIDDVPNRDRAPLVWQYLNAHFAPAFNEDGVVFWTRPPAARTP